MDEEQFQYYLKLMSITTHIPIERFSPNIERRVLINHKGIKFDKLILK